VQTICSVAVIPDKTWHFMYKGRKKQPLSRSFIVFSKLSCIQWSFNMPIFFWQFTSRCFICLFSCVCNFMEKIAPLEEQCHNSKKAHFDSCPQELCLRPYLPSGIASHAYLLKWPQEGRSVVLLIRFLRPGQWVLLSPEKLYFSNLDSVLLGVRYVKICTIIWIIYFLWNLQLSMYSHGARLMGF
jgi:hypothetical protein